MRQIGLLLLSVLLSHALAGCSVFSREKDTAEPPADLVEFKDEIKIDEVWSRSIGVGADKQSLHLVPALADGRLYLADHKGKVVALKATDGTTLWQQETGAAVSGGPGIGDGMVLLGTTDGQVIALEADSGKELWRTTVSSEILSVPAAAAGLVVVQTVDGKLFGLSAKDGARRWIYDRDVSGLTLRGSSSPLINGDLVFVGEASGRLSAIGSIDGRPQWEARISVPRGRSELERLSDVDAEPLLVDDVVYAVTYQGRLAAVSRYEGSLLWAREMSSYTGLTADSDQLYASDDSGAVWALDRKSGASLWKQAKLFARGITAPTVLNNAVLVGDAQGYLHWLSRDDGRFIARVKHGSAAIQAAPVTAAGTVFVLDSAGDISAYRPHP